MRYLIHLIFFNDWKVSYAYLADLRDLVIRMSRASKDTSESEMIQTEQEKPSDDEKARSTTLISNTLVHFLGHPGTATHEGSTFSANYGAYKPQFLRHVHLKVDLCSFKTQPR